MNSIKISVVVPVYNVEEYIERGIESLVNQTYKNLEIILVDDGSTDNSGKICDEYAKKDNRIIVIHKENGGIVSARKAGIAIASGEYSVNFDPDDWIEEDAYENCVAIIEKHGPDIVAYGYTKEFDGLVKTQPISLEPGFYDKEQFWETFNRKFDEGGFFVQPVDLCQWDKVVKTELFRKHQNNCSEILKKNVDDAVVFPMLLDMNSIYIDSRCWYHYCVRQTSIVWKSGKQDLNRYILLEKHLIDSYKAFYNGTGYSKKYFLYKIVHDMMLDLPEMFFREDKCMLYPQIKKDSKVVVYGKGVFANRLMARMNELQFGEIVLNVDSSDINRLRDTNPSNYDYILVALFNTNIIATIEDNLKENKLPMEKVLCIRKEDINRNYLSEEIVEYWEEKIGGI